MEKILVIKHGALGDFIHQLRWMKTIRREHPKAEITLITASSQKSLAQASGYFDKIVIDDRNYNPLDWYRIIKQTIVDGHFEVIYNLQGSTRVVKKYLPLARLASSHNLVIRYPAKREEKDNVKEVTFKKKYPLTLGSKTTRSYYLELEKEDMSFCKLNYDVKKMLPKEKFVLMIPGCSKGHDYKRWSPENYGKLASLLKKANIETLIIGTTAEQENIEKIIRLSPQAVSLMNKTSLTDIPPLAKHALVTVGNDTGPLHFVCTAGYPVVALFGPETATSQDKSPNVTNFVGQTSINDITVEEVFSAITTRG